MDAEFYARGIEREPRPVDPPVLRRGEHLDLQALQLDALTDLHRNVAIAGTRYPAAHMAALDSEKR